MNYLAGRNTSEYSFQICCLRINRATNVHNDRLVTKAAFDSRENEVWVGTARNSFDDEFKKTPPESFSFPRYCLFSISAEPLR